MLSGHERPTTSHYVACRRQFTRPMQVCDQADIRARGGSGYGQGDTFLVIWGGGPFRLLIIADVSGE